MTPTLRSCTVLLLLAAGAAAAQGPDAGAARTPNAAAAPTPDAAPPPAANARNGTAASERVASAEQPAQARAAAAADADVGREARKKGAPPDAAPEGGVKTLAGMSILGNQEAPKSLVIVPWKTSELGDGIGVSRALDTSIGPVDKDVFMRELKYYEIRESGGK